LVNPDHPAQAVLTRHLGTLSLSLVPLAFVVAGALEIIHTVRQARSLGQNGPIPTVPVVLK
jgi:hypothetical protein